MNNAIGNNFQARKVAKNNSIRVSASTQKKIDRILGAANKKKFGRKVRSDCVLSLALDLITNEHIKVLQDQSMRNADRIEVLRQRYIETRGPISCDDFAGFILTAAFQDFLLQPRHETGAA